MKRGASTGDSPKTHWASRYALPKSRTGPDTSPAKVLRVMGSSWGNSVSKAFLNHAKVLNSRFIRCTASTDQVPFAAFPALECDQLYIQR